MLFSETYPWVIGTSPHTGAEDFSPAGSKSGYAPRCGQPARISGSCAGTSTEVRDCPRSSGLARRHDHSVQPGRGKSGTHRIELLEIVEAPHAGRSPPTIAQRGLPRCRPLPPDLGAALRGARPPARVPAAVCAGAAVPGTPHAAQLPRPGRRWQQLRLLLDMPDASVDAVITDPPYSSGGQFRGDRTGATSDKYQTTGTEKTYAEFIGDTRPARLRLLERALALAECWRVAKAGAPICLFTDWRQLPTTTDMLQAGGWLWRCRDRRCWGQTEGAWPQKGRFRNLVRYRRLGQQGRPVEWRRWAMSAGRVSTSATNAARSLHTAGKPIAADARSASGLPHFRWRSARSVLWQRDDGPGGARRRGCTLSAWSSCPNTGRASEPIRPACTRLVCS